MENSLKYDVYIFKHSNLLDNILDALGAYKALYPKQWPTNVFVRESSRFDLSSMTFGNAIDMGIQDWGFRDAFYFFNGEFYETDPPNLVEKKPVILTEQRTPPLSTLATSVRTRVRK
jgi:hypothetical protein